MNNVNNIFICIYFCCCRLERQDRGAGPSDCQEAGTGSTEGQTERRGRDQGSGMGGFSLKLKGRSEWCVPFSRLIGFTASMAGAERCPYNRLKNRGSKRGESAFVTVAVLSALDLTRARSTCPI